MKKYQIQILLFFVFLSSNALFGSTVEQQSAQGKIIDPEDVEILSDLWPRFVKINQPFKTPDSARLIRAKTRGLLMRVEGSYAIIDFGSDGTQRLHIDEINLLSQMHELLYNEKKRVKGGLFYRNMFNKFFKLKEDSFKQTEKKDVFPFDYSLLVYADLCTTDSEALVSGILSMDLEKWNELSCTPLLFPMDSTEKELLSDMRELNWIYPSSYHWTSESHWRSLSFDGATNPSAILIDRNGRTVARGNDTKFLDSIEVFIHKDVKKMNKIRKKYKLNPNLFIY